MNTPNITKAFRYGLDKSSRKHRCVQCGQKSAVRNVDLETGEYLPDHVSRCDRENRCGYNYTWAQWLKDTGAGQPAKAYIEVVPEAVKPLEYIPTSYLKRSLSRYNQNYLFGFLCDLFGHPVAIDLGRRYLLGTSIYWKGASVYWQIDETGQPRQCKIMLYDRATGKRKKEGATVERWDRKSRVYVKEAAPSHCSKIQGKYLPGMSKEANLEQCFFGQHLLAENPDAEVCVVESEKTALIASVYLPAFVWIATGGASGCRWREYAVYKALEGRSVTFFPDHGYFNRKSLKTCFTEWQERVGRIADVMPGQFRVSDLLEKRLSDTERNDEDLADLLLNRDEATGAALTEAGYPVARDYPTPYQYKPESILS